MPYEPSPLSIENLKPGDFKIMDATADKEMAKRRFQVNPGQVHPLKQKFNLFVC